MGILRLVSRAQALEALEARRMAPEHPVRWNETAVPWGEAHRRLQESPPDAWYYLQGERLLGPLQHRSRGPAQGSADE